MNIALSSTDIGFLGPLLILLAGSLLLLLVESFLPALARRLSFPLAVITMAVALYAVVEVPQSTNPLLTNWINFDSIGRLFSILFLVIGIGASCLAHTFFQRIEESRGEYYFLLISSLFGLILIAIAVDFLTLFLGLETLSISLYILCGYMKRWQISSEASLKYFLMGSLASAFLLYGVALIYGAVGNTRIDVLLNGFQGLSSAPDKVLFYVGIAMVTLGFAFKAAIVPFHVWAPDVYAGAPTPVTAFMAVGTKAGAFAAFVRVFLDALPNFDLQWNQALAWLAIATLIYANFVAMRQVQLRRFFAYSGISHAGFLLIPLVATTGDSLFALIFYLSVYSLATLGAFAVLSSLDERNEGVMVTDLNGLFTRAPALAIILSLCFLTLAGIPPTAGFLAKFYLFKIAFDAGYYSLVIVALMTTILSAYYYLRFIAIMFTQQPEQIRAPGASWSAALVGGITIVGIMVLSIYPAALIDLLT